MTSEPTEGTPTVKKALVCPLCGGRHFNRRVGRIESLWGLKQYWITLLTCENCQYILPFSGNEELVWEFIKT